jgi:hypothetical protein
LTGKPAVNPPAGRQSKQFGADKFDPANLHDARFAHIKPGGFGVKYHGTDSQKRRRIVGPAQFPLLRSGPICLIEMVAVIFFGARRTSL